MNKDILRLITDDPTTLCALRLVCKDYCRIVTGHIMALPKSHYISILRRVNCGESDIEFHVGRMKTFAFDEFGMLACSGEFQKVNKAEMPHIQYLRFCDMKVITLPPYPVGKAVGHGIIFLEEEAGFSIRIWKLMYPSLRFSLVDDIYGPRIDYKFPYYNDGSIITKIKHNSTKEYYKGNANYYIPSLCIEHDCDIINFGEYTITTGPWFYIGDEFYGDRQKILFITQNIIITERFILFRDKMPKVYSYKGMLLGLTPDGRIITKK